MSKHFRVKPSVDIIKLYVNDNKYNEPTKFKLLNSGDDVFYRLISKKNRNYNFDNPCGTILKKHFIEISVTLTSVTQELFNTEDIILANIQDKEFGNVIQSIELPLRVILINQCDTKTFSSIHSVGNKESPMLRHRTKQSFDEHTLGNVSTENYSTEHILSPNMAWLMKKILFIIICSACIIIIVLPVKGFPLSEPHPQDNWVIHLARNWPNNLLPNHLIQYLAILILGAAMAVFLLIF